MSAAELPWTAAGAPWVLGLGVAAIAAAGLYGSFAFAETGPPVNATVGSEQTVELEEGEDVELGLSWTTTLELNASPEGYRFTVAVPYAVEPIPPSADGVRVWTNATVNGETATNHLLRSSPGRVKLTVPGPHLDTEPFHRGSNRVEVSVDLHRSADHNGSAEVRIGPLIAEARPTDGDGDGVVDTRQPFVALHTGWVALAAGVGLGAPAGFAARIAAKRKEGSP